MGGRIEGPDIIPIGREPNDMDPRNGKIILDK
jgi:hypothetical protein